MPPPSGIPRGPGRRDSVGRGLQLLGLIVLPASILYGVQGGNLYDEILFAAVGVALLLIGRSVRGGG